MEYRQLGRSGLRVSKLCLGAMVGFRKSDLETATNVVHEAIELGVNFIDTADCYGESEETLGAILSQDNTRDKVVLATKFGWYMGNGANDYGASRYHVARACEESLRKLRTDHIDLYILHVVDANTPWEEMLGALDDLIRQGKVLYIGTSKHPATLILEALFASERCRLPRLVNEQTAYNILDRNAENELIPACVRHGVGVTAFFPLAGGMLSGKYRLGRKPPAQGRYAKAQVDRGVAFTTAALQAIEKLRPIAKEADLTIAELSLAWIMQQPGFTAAVVGARTPEYLRSAVKACDVRLTQQQLDQMDRIVPPGTFVSNFFEINCLKPLRMGFSSDARRTGAGAFIPDHRTGSDQSTGWGK